MGKITLLSSPKYSPTLMDESRDKMNKYVMGVFDLVINECCLTMHTPSLNTSNLVIHVKQIEEKNLNQMNREAKMARIGDGNSLNARSEGHRKPRFKMNSSNKDSPMVINDSVFNPNFERGNGGGYSFERSICAKSETQHFGKGHAGKDSCSACGMKVHKMIDFPTLLAIRRESK